uniref:Phosphopentomutase n=1 Tax=candidate division WOR-3 bacterium TaxID=2052148 RepID=A0A7C6EAS3_UNCW3
MPRAIIIVLDGIGIGELPDASQYNDEGSNSLGNLAKKVGGLFLPNLASLGLGNIIELKGVERQTKPKGSFGKMAEKSPGKDSTTGHWEIAGVILNQCFPIYPNGFPKELIEELEKAIGRKILGNIPASGTAIIEQLGEEHMRTGFPIVYTSADSVFQIAAHEDVIPVNELYEMCKLARRLLSGKHCVGRVIARPFIGSVGNFRRTKNRKDFSLEPPEPTLLDIAKMNGYPVIVIGKVDELFAHRGYTKSFHSVNNQECIDLTLQAIKDYPTGLIFTNLIQFDMDWGHRNDYLAYYNGLKEFDARLPEIISQLSADDLLAITADHGNDPTTPSTDHSREYVPLLIYSKSLLSGIDLGTRETFADLGQTVAEYLRLPALTNGKSFLKKLYKEKKDE